MQCLARAAVIVVALNGAAVATVAEGPTRITVSEAREFACESLTAAQKNFQASS
jgi:hypothetical protein